MPVKTVRCHCTSVAETGRLLWRDLEFLPGQETCLFCKVAARWLEFPRGGEYERLMTDTYAGNDLGGWLAVCLSG